MPDLFRSQTQTAMRAVLRIAEAVKKNNGRALLVGGFVRDALLGIASKDADLEVYGLDPIRLEGLLDDLYPGQVIAAGRAFGVLKVPLGNAHDVDVAIPRREWKSGQGHTGFLIDSDPSLAPEEAAARRDFTVNAIAVDPLTDELLDPTDGRQDLKKKILRVVHADTFGDDPLRVYRAVQFAARLGFTIDPSSFELLRGMAARGDLQKLSKERISDEIKKLLLKAEQPSVGFELMRDLGIIKRDYPELKALIGTPQEPEWHPEGDVWIHTMMVIDVAAKLIRQPDRNFTEDQKLQVMLGALCHDLGKPATTAMGEKDGVPRLRSLGHEEAGEEPTKRLCARWSWSQETERAAIVIAMQHLKPGMLRLQKEKGALTDQTYANAVRKLIKRIHPVSWRVLLAASEADSRGRTLPGVATDPYGAGDLFAATVTARGLDQEPTKPLVQGRDILARGVKPGPRVGNLIRQIENARDEGQLETREEALKMLDEILRAQTTHRVPHNQ